MSENKHEQHHHFHHHKNQNTISEATPYEKAMKEEKHHKRMEHLGELGAVAAGTFALYEKHKAKKDPENGHRHKIAEEIAATAAVSHLATLHILFRTRPQVPMLRYDNVHEVNSFPKPRQVSRCDVATSLIASAQVMITIGTARKSAM